MKQTSITVIGCGWLGFPLATRLVEMGHTVFGSTTTETKRESLEAVGIQSVIYSEDAPTLEEAAISSDWVVICFPPSKSTNYSQQIAQLLAQLNEKSNIIFTSSTGVYQETEGLVTEDSALMDNHPVKRAEEEVLRYSSRATILRLAGLIGSTRHPIYSLSKKTVLFANSGVNLVHLEDVLQALFLVISYEVTGEVFNVCNPAHPSKVDYYSHEAEKRGLELPLFEFSTTCTKTVDSSRSLDVLKMHYHSLR